MDVPFPMEFKCECGAIHREEMKRLRNGMRCPKCGAILNPQLFDAGAFRKFRTLVMMSQKWGKFYVRWDQNRLGVMFDEKGDGIRLINWVLNSLGFGNFMFKTAGFLVPFCPLSNEIFDPFSYSKYQLFLQEFRASQATSISITDFLQGAAIINPGMVMRPDWDYLSAVEPKVIRHLTMITLETPTNSYYEGGLQVHLQDPQGLPKTRYQEAINLLGLFCAKSQQLTRMFPHTEYQPAERCWGKVNPV